MIRKIQQDELFKHFYRLAAEVQCGSHFGFSNPKYESWLRRHISLDYHLGRQVFAFFQEDGSPVGIGALFGEELLDGTAGISELLDIGVLTEFRGKGQGKKFLDHAEEMSRSRSIYCMYIRTCAKDYEVIAFYGRSGFVPVATLPDVNGPGDDGDIFMRKILK